MRELWDVLNDTVSHLAIVFALATALAVGFLYSRQGVAKTWREVAEGRAEVIKERDATIGELRERLARVEATVAAQTREITTLKRHDLSAVLEWGKAHEEAARARALEAEASSTARNNEVLEVLRDIRDQGKAA